MIVITFVHITLSKIIEMVKPVLMGCGFIILPYAGAPQSQISHSFNKGWKVLPSLKEWWQMQQNCNPSH